MRASRTLAIAALFIKCSPVKTFATFRGRSRGPKCSPALSPFLLAIHHLFIALSSLQHHQPKHIHSPIVTFIFSSHLFHFLLTSTLHILFSFQLEQPTHKTTIPPKKNNISIPPWPPTFLNTKTHHPCCVNKSSFITPTTTWSKTFTFVNAWTWKVGYLVQCCLISQELNKCVSASNFCWRRAKIQH